jgi:hypothetical protein
MGIIETKLGRLPDMPSPGKFRKIGNEHIGDLVHLPVSRALSSRRLAREHVLTEELPISLTCYISTPIMPILVNRA